MAVWRKLGLLGPACPPTMSRSTPKLGISFSRRPLWRSLVQGGAALFENALHPYHLRLGEQGTGGQFHIQSAKANGVTKSEMAEILTHLAFYAGWPNA